MKKDKLNKVKTWAFYLFGAAFLLGMLRFFLNYFLAKGYRNEILNGQQLIIPMYSKFGYFILPFLTNMSGICGVIAGFLFIVHLIVKIIIFLRVCTKKI